jgi:diguanylate cyclase (GGDEF)-like protein
VENDLAQPDLSALQRLLEYQTVILRTQRELLNLDDPREMYQKLVVDIVEKTEAIGAAVVTREGENGILSIQAMADAGPSPPEGGGDPETGAHTLSRALCPTVLAGRVFESGRPEGPLDPGSSALTKEVDDRRSVFHRVRSVLAIPVRIGRDPDPSAVLVIESEELRHFTEALSGVLMELAISLGVGLARYRERQELEAVKAEIEILAFHDALTHLPNRRFLEERLERSMNRTDCQGTTLAVCMIDLDAFKPVNDSCGHKAGDLVLLEIASRLRTCLRDTDFLARLGGDEFVLLLENVRDRRDLETTLETIGKTVRQPVRLDGGKTVMVDLSAGVCLFPLPSSEDPDACHNPDLLLRLSDHALYESKARKGDRPRFWTVFGESFPPVPEA